MKELLEIPQEDVKNMAACCVHSKGEREESAAKHYKYIVEKFSVRFVHGIISSVEMCELCCSLQPRRRVEQEMNKTLHTSSSYLAFLTCSTHLTKLYINAAVWCHISLKYSSMDVIRIQCSSLACLIKDSLNV